MRQGITQGADRWKVVLKKLKMMIFKE